MINIFLSRAEALLIVELLNKANESLVQSLIIGVEEENDKDNLARAAKENYVTNLEMEVRRLEQHVAAQKRTPEAPHGLKKDGTPRAKPGRKTKLKTKGTK